jgi:hypothetical protein
MVSRGMYSRRSGANIIPCRSIKAWEMIGPSKIMPLGYYIVLCGSYGLTGSSSLQMRHWQGRAEAISSHEGVPMARTSVITYSRGEAAELELN